MSTTAAHTQHETLEVEVNVPAHAKRETTALFRRSREQLIEREKGRCWVSGLTAEQTGHPLEAHHHPIERCMAEMIDWDRFAHDARAGHWGPHAQGFDWEAFFEGATLEHVTIDPTEDQPGAEPYTITFRRPRDPYLFVDDMTVNGLLLARDYHTGRNEGIHDLPYPIWIARKYGREGYVFSSVETIHNARESA
jgi:hypothetical protein